MGRKTGKDIRVEMDKDRAKEKAEYGGFDKWEVDSWASTLQSAAEIMSDPKKMKAVAKCLAKKETALATLKEMTAGKGKQSQQGRDEY